MSPSNNSNERITRRNFSKLTGLGGLFAVASVPGFAGADDVSFQGNVDNTIEETFTPSEWLTAGPFQYQRRDSMSDWLTPVGGEQQVATGEIPAGDEFLGSAYAASGQAEWQEHTLDEGQSEVPLDFSGAIDPSGDGDYMPLTGDGLFDNHHGWYGIGGVLFSRAYALTVFERSEPGVAVLESDASQVWINGQMYDTTPAGVVLQEGTNVVLAKQTVNFGAGSVKISFRPPEAPVEVNAIERVPDLPSGEAVDQHAAVRVTNTTPEQVEDLTLTLGPEEGDLIEEQEVSVAPPLAPFETRFVNTRVVTNRPVDPGAESVEPTVVEPTEVPENGLATTAEGDVPETEQTDTVEIKAGTQEAHTTVVATASVSENSHQATTSLTVRESGDPIITTFESDIDESVQQFGYRRPANFDGSEGPYEAVHYLHGANVNAESAANSIAPREDLYVIAPETRGPSAFDHEDIGRVDDMEVLAVAKERFDIDDDQVYLMGHSMGGHGTWHIGMTHTDRYAAIGPQHGWLDHESYIITPFKRDRLHSHPHMWAAREISLYKNRAGPNTENLADGNTPVFATQGGADPTVPPLMPRTHVRMLANRGLSIDTQAGDRYDGSGPDDADVAYLEVPAVGHWWDKDIGPGSDVVNHPDQFRWVRENERDPLPAEVQFYTTNLAIENSKYWVTVLEQRTPNTPTRVHGAVEGNTITVDMENVGTLAIDVDVVTSAGVDQLSLVGGSTYQVSASDAVSTSQIDGIDGDTPTLDGGSRRIVVNPDLGVVNTANGGVGRKRADQYGPMRHVHYSPYRIVYGTQGDNEETTVARGLANLRSHRLAGRARASPPVLPDTAVTDDIVQNYNLVLIGTPSSNSVIGEYSNASPISVDEGSVTVGTETYQGDLGVQYVYPNPDAPGQLIQVTSGSSTAGLRLNQLINWLPTQTPSPDYMVFDEDFRYQAFEACLAAGHFGKRWELDPALGHQRQTFSF